MSQQAPELGPLIPETQVQTQTEEISDYIDDPVVKAALCDAIVWLHDMDLDEVRFIPGGVLTRYGGDVLGIEVRDEETGTLFGLCATWSSEDELEDVTAVEIRRIDEKEVPRQFWVNKEANDLRPEEILERLRQIKAKL